MQAGTLRHRVAIQALTHTQNEYGEPVETWAAVGTVWAEVRAAAGAERFVSGADQEQATITHMVTMRWFDGLSPVNHRLVWRERTLDVESVRKPGRREAMCVVQCREVVG